MENVRKHIDIRLLTGDRKGYFVVRTKLWHNKMIFRNVLETKMNKIKVKMNKPLYICMLILEIRKKLRYKSWYHSIKSKY